MFFGDLTKLLLDRLRARVLNGELTERGLAKLVGVSQPHMHNLLNGKRSLNSEMADRMLFHLRMSAFDLVDSEIFARYLACGQQADSSVQSFLPILEGKLGPAQPWPGAVMEFERFPVPQTMIARMWQPVVVRLAEDIRMHPLFGDGDLALLDQSARARTEIDSSALYVVRRGRVGLLRRLRHFNRSLYLITEDSLDNPAAWEQVPLEAMHITHVVRAKATLVSRALDWPA